MRPYCTFLFFLIFVSIVHAQNGTADPDMLEIERELELIEAELKQELLESSNEASLPTDKEPETESFESNEMNNPAPGFGVTLDSNDERMKIREELIAIQRELDKLGGQPVRTYNPGNSEVNILEISEVEDEGKEIEKNNASADSGVMDEKSIIREELLAIQRELNLLNNGLIEETVEPVNQEIEQRRESFQNDESLSRGMGGYILPFFGITKADGLNWKTQFGGEIELKQKNGHSFGYRIGHRWSIIFMDFQMSYHENEIEAFESGGRTFLPGMSKVLAYNASIGAKMYINPKTFITLGGGLGASDQSIKQDSISEDDVVLNYQFFTGLNYFPSEHFQVGLRYRWVKTEAMDIFSSHDLHIGEISIGYSH
jgi:opacity protein-like surface antigen